MPIVHIEMWADGMEEMKRNIATGITEVVVSNVGCPAEAVTIIFTEVPKANWVIGGQFCSDIFKHTE